MVPFVKMLSNNVRRNFTAGQRHRFRLYSNQRAKQPLSIKMLRNLEERVAPKSIKDKFIFRNNLHSKIFINPELYTNRGTSHIIQWGKMFGLSPYESYNISVTELVKLANSKHGSI